MDMLREIEKRQSVKKFRGEKLDKEQVERILEAGRQAPSAKNRQPWRFIIIDDEELKGRIKTASFNQEHVGEAPVIIAACSTNIDYRMPNGHLSYPIDISIAVSFMMVQAEHEGLGTCVVTTYDEQEVKDLLTVPYSMKVVMLLLIGYPMDKPLPELRKPLSSIIAYNHW